MMETTLSSIKRWPDQVLEDLDQQIKDHLDTGWRIESDLVLMDSCKDELQIYEIHTYKRSAKTIVQKDKHGVIYHLAKTGELLKSFTAFLTNVPPEWCKGSIIMTLEEVSG